MTEIASRQAEGLFSNVSLRSLYRAWRTPENDLEAHEAASTLFRFFRSAHVRDLKLIAALTLTLLAIFIALVVIFGIVDAATAKAAQGVYTDPWVSFFKFVVTFVGSAIGVAGFVVGWAYQTASARLGVVDLFACEISTLCRVGTIVDIGTQYVGQYDAVGSYERETAAERKLEPAASPAGNPSNFVSQENYFPILQTNAEDLQRLEALVVRPITEFYTYVKAFRDYLRILDTKMGAGRRDALIDAVYMLFLGYESGRHAVKDLIEYQPRRAEDTIVILLTELKCYSVLARHFREKNDYRYARLELRQDEYKREVPDVCLQLKEYADDHPDWTQAKRLISELVTRYEEAVGETMSKAVDRREAEVREEKERGTYDRRSTRPRAHLNRLTSVIGTPTTPPQSHARSADALEDEYRSSGTS
jgi:hypothetical protein